MKLEGWVDEAHLAAQVIARRRAAFASDRFRSIVLNGFLAVEKHRALQQLFASDGRFEDYLGRWVRSNPATRQAGGKPFYEYRVKTAAGWSRVPEERRLAHELMLAGPAAGCEHQPGWTTHLDFRTFLASEAFAGFLEGMTGIRTGPHLEWMPRIMRPGHFVRAHDDTGRGRALCMIYFVGGGWRPGYGARFQNVADGRILRSIEPQANRLIIHEPLRSQTHQVEPFGPDAADWERRAYSIWLHGPED